MRLAAQFEVPVIPFGVGSSLECHLLAVQGGISLDVSRMNRVLAVNGEDLTVTSVAQGRDAAESIHRALTMNGRA